MKLIVALAILAAIWWMAQRKRTGGLSPSEARSVLSVGPEAGPEEITAAHRRLIAKVHPDAGGSAALAAKVNAARDVLLTGRS